MLGQPLFPGTKPATALVLLVAGPGTVPVGIVVRNGSACAVLRGRAAVGESNVDQLVEIIKVVGTPTREEIQVRGSVGVVFCVWFQRLGVPPQPSSFHNLPTEEGLARGAERRAGGRMGCRARARVDTAREGGIKAHPWTKVAHPALPHSPPLFRALCCVLLRNPEATGSGAGWGGAGGKAETQARG
eukprot:2044858-Rhodomonas_salina.1